MGGTPFHSRRAMGPPDEIPHVRLIRGVIIVRAENAERVTAFLEGIGATVHAKRVELTMEDLAALAGSRAVA